MFNTSKIIIESIYWKNKNSESKYWKNYWKYYLQPRLYFNILCIFSTWLDKRHLQSMNIISKSKSFIKYIQTCYSIELNSHVLNNAFSVVQFYKNSKSRTVYTPWPPLPSTWVVFKQLRLSEYLDKPLIQKTRWQSMW